MVSLGWIVCSGSYVCTLWYRKVESVLKEHNYDQEITSLSKTGGLWWQDWTVGRLCAVKLGFLSRQVASQGSGLSKAGFTVHFYTPQLKPVSSLCQVAWPVLNIPAWWHIILDRDWVTLDPDCLGYVMVVLDFPTTAFRSPPNKACLPLMPHINKHMNNLS